MSAIGKLKELLGFDADVVAIEEHLQGAVREAANLVARDAALAAELERLAGAATRVETIAQVHAWIDAEHARFRRPPTLGDSPGLQHCADNLLAPCRRLEQPAEVVNGQPVYRPRSERPGPPDFTKATPETLRCWLDPEGYKAEWTRAITGHLPEDDTGLSTDERMGSIAAQADAIRAWRARERARVLAEKAEVAAAHARVRETMGRLKEKLQALIDPLPDAAKREHDEAVAATDAARNVERARLERTINDQVGKR